MKDIIRKNNESSDIAFAFYIVIDIIYLYYIDNDIICFFLITVFILYAETVYPYTVLRIMHTQKKEG